MRFSVLFVRASTIVALGLLGTTANAALLIDVRLADGTKSAVVTPGSTFTINVFATATGVDGNTANEGIQSLFGSMLSSNGGLPVNYTSVLAVSPFASNNRQDTSSNTKAALTDLDGDGDIDVGSNNVNSSAGFLFPRADGIQAGSTEFHLLTATIMVPLDAGDSLSTDLNWRIRGRTNSVGLWRVDNVTKNSFPGTTSSSDVVTIGAPVTVSTAIPEPAALGLLPIATASLLRRKPRR